MSASVRRTAPSLGLEHILQSPLRADVLELVLFQLFITIEQVLQNLLYSRFPVFVMFAIQRAETSRTKINRMSWV